jgi:hypothetical protein
VKLSAPNLTRFPGFASAKLRETVVGPGDVLLFGGYWDSSSGLKNKELPDNETVRPLKS